MPIADCRLPISEVVEKPEIDAGVWECDTSEIGIRHSAIGNRFCPYPNRTLSPIEASEWAWIC
jgi:hypothetical protein